MRNFWLVAKHEYGRVVLRRTFIIITLAIPLGFAALIALVIFVEQSGESSLPIGYVDYAGVLDEFHYTPLPNTDNGIAIWQYADEASALAALEKEEIQAFFILPAGYPGSLQTELYYLEEPPSGDAWREFNHFVRLNLVAQYPDEISHRLIEGANITVHDIVSNREFSEDGTINIVLPFIASIIFFTSSMSASGYMIEVVADEKENRTMEIMLTTLTPGQLIGGKALGLLAATLTQLGINILMLVTGLIIARPYVADLQNIVVPWTYIGVMALFFFPAYTLISAIMIAAGSAVTNLHQGEQLAGILNLFFILPLFLTILIFEDPASPVLVFFSLFPTTAFMMISLRWGVGTVPFWQIGISWILLVATAIFTLWAATKIFRVGMLRYGQPLSLRGVLASLRSAN